MLSVTKSTFAAILLAMLLVAGVTDRAQARKCIGCNAQVAKTNIQTVYRTKVLYEHRTVTRVRNVVRTNYVVRPQAQRVVHAAAPRGRWHWDRRPSRHYVWPGSGSRNLSCDSLR
jgi:hypothetical protein